MQLTNLTYEGKKVYKDEYANVWSPGDTKLVTDEQAGRLLRFPVFVRPKTEAKAGKKADDKKADDVTVDAKKVQEEDAAAQAQREATEKAHKEATQRENERLRQEKQEAEAKENMLLLVEGMDKGALAEYAQKYETKLNKKQSVGDLRIQVAGLVEQFGAR